MCAYVRVWVRKPTCMFDILGQIRKLAYFVFYTGVACTSTWHKQETVKL